MLKKNNIVENKNNEGKTKYIRPYNMKIRSLRAFLVI